MNIRHIRSGNITTRPKMGLSSEEGGAGVRQVRTHMQINLLLN